jgi:hypothetical protein
MSIWKLEPVNLIDNCWRASTYAGEVVIRAESEIEARLLAARAFGKAVEVNASQPVAIVPWDVGNFVSARLLQSSEYDEVGPKAILGPPLAVQSADI